MCGIFPTGGIDNEKLEQGKRRILETINSRKDLLNDSRHKNAANFTLYSKKNNLACTFIPKNGCSNLRYSFAIANNLIHSEEEFDWIHSNNSTMSASIEDLIGAKLNFIILRCPFARAASYFLDKLLTKSGQDGDKSYELSQSLFEPQDDTFTFEQFIECLWMKPHLIDMDIHLKHQSDFLIMQDYDNWFDVSQFAELKSLLKNRVDFTLFDTREIANHTTHKLNKIHDTYLGNIPLNELRRLKEEENACQLQKACITKPRLNDRNPLYARLTIIHSENKNMPESSKKLIGKSLQMQ